MPLLWLPEWEVGYCTASVLHTLKKGVDCGEAKRGKVNVHWVLPLWLLKEHTLSLYLH